MKGVDILAAFELEINKLDDAINKPATDDSLYWINQAVVKFVKDRFNGNAPKRTSYEQNEKRTRDLILLLRERMTINSGDGNFLLEEDVYRPESSEFYDIDKDNIYTQWYELYEGDDSKEYIRYSQVYGDEDMSGTSVGSKNGGADIIMVSKSTKHPSYNVYEYEYPKDMMYVLNEDVIISDLNDDHLMDTCVFECTADNFMYRVNNKLTDFHYRFHRARPLRVRTRDGFRLLTDKKYKIHSYTLGYLKTPDEITNDDPFKDYQDFKDNVWLEIIKIAAQMYIENQSDPRYKTITNEVLTQE